MDVLAIAAGLVALWLLFALMTAVERMQPRKPASERAAAGKLQGKSRQRPGQ